MDGTSPGKGRPVIPATPRAQTRLRSGDRVDLKSVNGLIVIRQRQQLTPTQVRTLLSAGQKHPQLKPVNEVQVDNLAHSVRSVRHHQTTNGTGV